MLIIHIFKMSKYQNWKEEEKSEGKREKKEERGRIEEVKEKNLK